MRYTWSADIIDRLRTYWYSGQPASQCARAINAEFGTRFSRNAVIGKAHRIGLVQRGRNFHRVPAPAPPPKPRQVKKLRTATQLKASPSLAAIESGTFAQFADSEASASIEALELDVFAQPVTITELRSHHCRWPLGNRFCGARRLASRPYCRAHALIAYQPASKRKERAA